MLAREMTKLHQEFLWGTAAAVLAKLATVKGEFTLAISPSETAAQVAEAPSDASIAADFLGMTKISRAGRRAAIQTVARKHGLSPKAVYQIVERHKTSG
jgi:16S rRNA (cytidine1402-2'-O)-methyltransferase